MLSQLAGAAQEKYPKDTQLEIVIQLQTPCVPLKGDMNGVSLWRLHYSMGLRGCH
jgi:hypothetical protein